MDAEAAEQLFESEAVVDSINASMLLPPVLLNHLGQTSQVKFNADPSRAVCAAARVTLDLNVFSDFANEMLGQSKSGNKTLIVQWLTRA